MKKLLLWLLLIILIIFRYFSIRPQYHQGDLIRVTGIVRNEPVRYEYAQSFKLAGLKIYLPPYPEINYGDQVTVKGKVGESKLNYPKLITHQESHKVLFSLRKSLIQIYQKSLPQPHSALIAGVTLGSKASLSTDFYQTLKRSGTLHVVVASGMNVTLVAVFLINTLILFVHRRKATIIALLGIWIYSFIAGFDAPIIRAALMGSIALLAQTAGKLYQTWHALFLSALLMLAINPPWLEDIGFILSFVSTASLMLFERKINRLIRFVPSLFREGLSTSLAAQIGVAPILFVTFGQFNPLSPLINALILWTIPPITIFAALTGLIGLLVPSLAKLMLLLIFPLTYYFITITTLFT